MELGAGGLLRELGSNVNRHQKCRRHTMTQEIEMFLVFAKSA